MSKTKLTTKKRHERAAKLAAALREFSDRKFTRTDLLEIFGRAFMAKFREKPTRHQLPGKHHGGHHARIELAKVEGMKDDSIACRYEHPAGTKLVRRFIRASRGEQTQYRLVYAALTGHQL